MSIPAKTIDEVLNELDLIIDETVADNNFLGIFAYVYRRTTAQIKQAINDNQFMDNKRMELMDVAFANLYLMAYRQYRAGLPCSSAWMTAFDAKNDSVTIMQHLMLGMNTHINLDLGIAAAAIASGDKLQLLKTDFMKVNQILNELVNEMQSRISRVSRLMFLLDLAGKNTDEQIVNFSMVKAREQSWNLANILAVIPVNNQQPAIDLADQTISAFGSVIKNPPGKFLKFIVRIVAYFEEKNVKTIIVKLREE